MGIDPHKQMHLAVALADNGTRLGRPLKVPTGPEALERLLAWIRPLAQGRPVLWAIEGGPGLGRAVADALLLHGQQVVWVPVRAMAAQRRITATRGAKSDVIDAVAVARAAMADPHLARHRIDPRVRQIRLLVDLRADLVERRVAVANRLATMVHVELEHAPGGLSSGAALARVRQVVAAAAVEETVRWVLLALVGELEGLLARIREVERRLRELVEPVAPHLLAIAGVGVVSAAVLLSQVGDVERFASSAKLARYAGCAPIPVFSADRERHRLHRGGNRQVNRVLHTVAMVQAQRFGPAREYVAARVEAKGKRGAQRALKRHLVDVVYRAMVADRQQWRAEEALQEACQPAA
ncbi:IS110 family transposase [Nocardiopsis algeriensis]|uniref:Transposase n=1 Tax=Nocardiopsis algeriensis TaxID=1478215 RepID=A0A841IP50_9ACTN|nr:transposase [Nocardiopsis algeriensis]